jgi:hypothetical protein
MADPLEDLAGFDWEAFAKEAEANAGDDGRQLAENVARNLTESIRQPRNALEAAVNSPKTEAEIYDQTDLTMAPQNQRNLQASFENHLRGLFRRNADALGRKMEAQSFFGFKPDGSAPVEFSLEEYATDDLGTLGEHPHSEVLAVPVPKGYEDAGPYAARLALLSPEKQKAWLEAYRKAIEADDEIPPIPER